MKKMKKAISVILTAAMIMSMGVTAFAVDVKDTEVSDTVAVSEAMTFAFKKEYKSTTDERTMEIVPSETLDFAVSADTNNPDDTMITVEDPTIASNPQDVKLTIPTTYKKVGKYNYTVSENSGTTQGVGYSNATFNVQVLVMWDTNHENLLKQVTLTSGTAGAKVDRIINTYDLGSLSVNKTVTGNLASTSKEFDVVVTFTTENGLYVNSDITFDADGNGEISSEETIAKGWTGTKTVTISLHDTETITFNNIPKGVTYNVDEADYTGYDATLGKENDENGYDAPKYSETSADTAVSVIVNADNSKTDVTYVENTVVADTEGKAFIVNNKSTEVNTGISLDNMPYIMVLALVALGLVGFVSKKRSMEF